ncbi:MAG: hypothetical protein ACD_58C00027G0004 [uncultured bacterium]|nr:MAG: hypothetical protein ACD_58C00027G0004 [uncultured bacterium]
MKNLKPCPLNLTPYTRGYSLIEVLIASGIFAGVMAMVFATFSVNSSLRNQTKAIRDASISGRYAMEAIARDFRLADSYSILGDNITINSYDQDGNKVIHEYFLGQCLPSPNTNVALCTKIDNGSAQALTSTNINILNINTSESIFNDRNSGATETMQPILEIKFKISANLGKKQTDKFTQTLETAVSGRAYKGFNRSILVEQLQ